MTDHAHCAPFRTIEVHDARGRIVHTGPIRREADASAVALAHGGNRWIIASGYDCGAIVHARAWIDMGDGDSAPIGDSWSVDADLHPLTVPKFRPILSADYYEERK